jgi:hypothetical protein
MNHNIVDRNRCMECGAIFGDRFRSGSRAIAKPSEVLFSGYPWQNTHLNDMDEHCNEGFAMIRV